MKKVTTLFLAFLLLFSIAACGAKSASSNSVTMDMAEPEIWYSKTEAAPEAPAASAAPMPAPEEPGRGYYEDASDLITSVDSSIYTDPNAKVIRTAYLTLQTLDFEQSVSDLAALTERFGGYYETAQVNSGGYYDKYASRSAYYIVRIPKENFVAFRDSVGSVGHIRNFNEDAQNIGEQYADTEARLKTLETKRERLLSLLEKAEIMEDIISLENALADVQYQIDQYSTTLRKYDSKINYSTFTINLDEVFEIKEEEPGPKEGFGTRLLASLKAGFENFVDTLEDFAFWFARNIFGIVIFVVIIIIAVKIFFVIRKKRHANDHEDH